MTAFSTEKPSIFEAVGNGNYLYHYDIQECDSTEPASDGQSKKMWRYEEETICPPLTSNRITEAVITGRFPSNYELKVINDFNGIALNLCSDEEEATAKAQRYQEYLSERARIKAIIDADCKTFNIE